MTAGDAMALDVLPGAIDIMEVRDTGDVTDSSRMFHYSLLDRSLIRQTFTAPIARYSTRHLGDMNITLGTQLFGTAIDIGGPGLDRYYFSVVTEGQMALVANGVETVAAGNTGLVLRARPGTRARTSNRTGRINWWIDAATLEATLERMLGHRLRGPLEFRPGIDWTKGSGGSLRGQIEYLMREVSRKDGLADNAIALASFSDVMAKTVLTGLPHSFLDRLNGANDGAVPAYLRRAEEFMRAHAQTPIRMKDVAAAARCSERTLTLVFQRFRETTPLAALQAIRLEYVRDALRSTRGDVATSHVARQFGFTNAGRFSAAYRIRFGETPAETAGRAPRSPTAVRD